MLDVPIILGLWNRGGSQNLSASKSVRPTSKLEFQWRTLFQKARCEEEVTNITGQSSAWYPKSSWTIWEIESGGGGGADDEARWKAENSQRREIAGYGSWMSPREPSHLELLTLRHQTYDIVSFKTCRTPRFRDPKSCNTSFYYWPNELQLASSK